MASTEEQKPPKQLTDARHNFQSYLRENLSAGHYLSVSGREAPLRRADGDRVTAPAQLAVIQEDFKWDSVQSRWTLKDGGRIVIEDEIYDVILSFQRVFANSRDKLFNHISNIVEGIQVKDVAKAVKLWTEHDLGLLFVWDDALWGGPAAVYVPDRASKSSEGSLISAPVLAPSSHSPESDDSSHSTHGTNLSAGTRSNHQSDHSKLEAPRNRRFHPTHPCFLHIGTCGDDGTDVWLSMSLRADGNHQPIFRDSLLRVKNEKALNIAWNEEFNITKFPAAKCEPGHYGREKIQRRAQRRYLQDIILQQKDEQVPLLRTARRGSKGRTRARTVQIPSIADANLSSKRNVVKETSQSVQNVTRPMHQKTDRQARRSLIAAMPLLKPASNKRRHTTHVVGAESSGEDEQEAPRPPKRAATTTKTDVISISSDSPELILPKTEPHDITLTPAFGQLSPNIIAGTSLLVSASNLPMRAPANVPLEDCGSQAQLFETLVMECNLKGKAASDLSEVSATYTWGSQKQHLIRKARPRDWKIFCEDIRKAWDREEARFAEEGCEIKMMVHVEA